MEILSRLVEDIKVTDNVGTLVESIFTREFLPREYQLDLWQPGSNNNSHVKIRICPSERHIILENFDKNRNQMSIVLETPQANDEESKRIRVSVTEGKQGSFKRIVEETIARGQNGKWNRRSNLLMHLKIAKPILTSLNNYLNTRSRRLIELKRQASGSWSFVDLEEAPRSRPVVDYSVNENEEDKPITQISMLVPSAPDESRKGQIGHILFYKMEGAPMATAVIGEQRHEVYKVKSVLENESPQYMWIIRQRINEDTHDEELSVIGGNAFALDELQEHIAHSLFGESFDGWLQQVKAEKLFPTSTEEYK